jgi:hypothetical protein
MKANKLLLYLLLFLHFSCKKSESNDCNAFGVAAPPSGFYFIIKQNNSRLPDSILNNLKLSYFIGGNKFYISDFSRAGSEGYNLGAMASWEIGLKSADSNIKDYFIEFPSGDIDTIYVDYKHYTACQADTSSCHCIYPRIGVKYNGQWASYDPSVTQQQVYLFNKP